MSRGFVEDVARQRGHLLVVISFWTKREAYLFGSFLLDKANNKKAVEDDIAPIE